MFLFQLPGRHISSTLCFSIRTFSSFVDGERNYTDVCDVDTLYPQVQQRGHETRSYHVAAKLQHPASSSLYHFLLHSMIMAYQHVLNGEGTDSHFNYCKNTHTHKQACKHTHTFLISVHREGIRVSFSMCFTCPHRRHSTPDEEGSTA